MAVYEYICLGCERPFEQRRAIGASVDTALACPACGDDRVRRRFSVFGTGIGAASQSTAEPGPPAGGCCGGGACACGH